MLVVRHEFKDKYTDKVIKVGTVLEIEDEERKKDLLSRQLIEEAEVLILKKGKNDEKEAEKIENIKENTTNIDESELTVREIKKMLDDAGIEYSPRDNKAKLLELLKGVK